MAKTESTRASDQRLIFCASYPLFLPWIRFGAKKIYIYIYIFFFFNLVDCKRAHFKLNTSRLIKAKIPIHLRKVAGKDGKRSGYLLFVQLFLKWSKSLSLCVLCSCINGSHWCTYRKIIYQLSKSFIRIVVTQFSHVFFN